MMKPQQILNSCKKIKDKVNLNITNYEEKVCLGRFF